MSSTMHVLSKIVRYVKYRFSPVLIVNGYFFVNNGKLEKNNFGDDINFPLLEALTGKKVVALSQTGLIRLPHLMCIGSIVDYCINSAAYIWGSGTTFGDSKLPVKPRKVLAVRGPLTRESLLRNGIVCPPVYGDPALLLPLAYSPHVEKKYKLGIIPHFEDYDLPHVAAFRNNNSDVHFIKMRNYESWQKVIEEICSCECIASSSLHGLIVADAYGIPNTRVVFSDLIWGGDFKFKDYYSGVHREYFPPVSCRERIDLNIIEKAIKKYNPITFKPEELLQVFPYPLSTKFKALARNENLD